MSSDGKLIGGKLSRRFTHKYNSKNHLIEVVEYGIREKDKKELTMNKKVYEYEYY